MIAWRSPRPRLLVLATVFIVLGEAATWLLLRSQGNDFGGDQAHYLIAGQAISHLSLHPLSQYQRDFATHFIYTWPTGAKLTDHTIVQTFPGPHGSVFAHGLGVPLLLAPFLAVGSVPLGLLGLFTLTALGFVCLHQRASELAGLRRRGQLVFALVLAAPALWLASTQLYPDLLSGVLLAMVLVEMALIEQRRQVSRFSAVVVAGSLAFVPWLQVKNVAPAACCILATAFLAWRVPERRRLIVAAAVVIVGWLLLAVYNQYYFSHLIGLPQPSPTFTLTTASRSLALLFDTHQGLLVQVPTVVLGLVGLSIGRRAIPWTASAAILSALLMVFINGTFTSEVPFGGTDLAGRFEWTALPMLVVWAPLSLVAIERHRARLLAIGTAVTALWLFEGVPILRGDHVFVNSMIAPFAPWDPTVYPGWWPFVGRWLPTFLPPGVRVGATWSQLLFEIVLLLGLAMLVYRWTKPDPLRVNGRLVAVAALGVAALIVAVTLPLRTQPTTRLAVPPHRIGSPWSGGSQPLTTLPIAITTDDFGSGIVGPGTYRLSLTYAAFAAHPAVAFLMATPPSHVMVSGWFTPSHPTDAALLKPSVAPVGPGSGPTTQLLLRPTTTPRRATLVIHVDRQSLLTFYVTVRPDSAYAATAVTLSKVAS